MAHRSMLVPLVLLAGCAFSSILPPSVTSTSDRPQLWASAAMQFLRNLKCDSFLLAVQQQCEKMLETPQADMNVYIAEASQGHKLTAQLPDGSLGHSGDHDGVLAIDPFPQAQFGHFVALFYLDHIDQHYCVQRGGIFIKAVGDCLRFALKSRCHHLPNSNGRVLRRGSDSFALRCEVDMLPTVRESNNSVLPTTGDLQKLRCRDGIGHFAICPRLVDANLTAAQISLEDNLGAPRCRLFEVCDQAVIIHGGWSQLTSRHADGHLLRENYRMLRDSGFPSTNIRSFYANGVQDTDGVPVPRLLPASAKSSLRSHIRQVCRSSHCVDTFAVFIRGPTLSSGKILLWDTNQNGIAEEGEYYSHEELIADMRDCRAEQVYLVVDTSYAGHLLKQLRGAAHSTHHRNLMAFSSGGPTEVSWSNEFLRHFTAKHRRDTCVSAIFETARKATVHSEAQMFDGSNGYMKTTIFGAPCDVSPPFTDAELKQNYLGCQNVPSSVWFRVGQNSRRPVSPDRTDPTGSDAESLNSLNRTNRRRTT